MIPHFVRAGALSDRQRLEGWKRCDAGDRSYGQRSRSPLDLAL